MVVVGGGGSKHERGEVLAAKPLHGRIDAVYQVEIGQSLFHAAVLAPVGSHSPGHDVQSYRDIAHPRTVPLLPPFDSFKFDEHGRKRKGSAAVQGIHIVIPKVDKRHVRGLFRKPVANGLEYLFSHCLMNFESWHVEVGKIVVDDPLDNLLCPLAVTDKLALRHGELAHVSLDRVGLAIFAAAGMGADAFLYLFRPRYGFGHTARQRRNAHRWGVPRP